MFKLNFDGSVAIKVGTLDCHNTDSSTEYLAWLAEDNVPDPADPVPNPRIAEIQSALAQLDLKLIRPLSEGETSRVAELVLQKQMLRDELATL
jgi:hypothetical protein